MLEPSYADEVSLILDKIEADPGLRDLWNAICDAVDLVCDHHDIPVTRRRGFRHPQGHQLWMVPIRHPGPNGEAWVMLWNERGDEAVIAYIGPNTFR